jgi:hypothetical protein
VVPDSVVLVGEVSVGKASVVGLTVHHDDVGVKVVFENASHDAIQSTTPGFVAAADIFPILRKIPGQIARACNVLRLQ